MSKPTCLILGANGFMGSHLVEKLAVNGRLQVKAFDRFSRPPQFEITDNVEIIRGDIFNDAELSRILKGVDLVMHSFSATTPSIADKNPYIDINNNLLRGVKIFELCAAAGVKKVGFISSGGAVYGSVAEKKAAAETDVPLPISPYGINKLSMEHYLEYFKRKTGMDYIAYRLTIPMFLEKINCGEKIIIHGDGTSSRDYIYAEDAATMIAASFTVAHKHSVYNIGSGVQTSVNDIIEALKKVSGKAVTVSYADIPVTFLKKTMVSVERLQEEFKLQSTTSLEEGLRRTLSG